MYFINLSFGLSVKLMHNVAIVLKLKYVLLGISPSLVANIVPIRRCILQENIDPLL